MLWILEEKMVNILLRKLRSLICVSAQIKTFPVSQRSGPPAYLQTEHQPSARSCGSVQSSLRLLRDSFQDDSSLSPQCVPCAMDLLLLNIAKVRLQTVSSLNENEFQQ